MALLECKSVSKDFGGITALKSVDLIIGANEILGLIGPNGAGKTTLFDVICGLYRPDSGGILLNGRSIVGLRPHQITQMGVARTFQSVRPLLSQTVFDNVLAGSLFGRGDYLHTAKAAEHRTEEILEWIGLEAKKNTRVKNLPIEHRKLVELGRALAANPVLLLLDEPMASLNPAEIARFIEMVRKMRDGGVSVVVVEHVMKAVMNMSDRIAVLHHGEKIADGPPQEVSRDKKVIEVYLGEQYSVS